VISPELRAELRQDLRVHRAQILAAMAYVVFGLGGLYVFSAIGEDTGGAWDTVRRSTNAVIGVLLLVAGLPFAVAALVTYRRDRHEQPPGAMPQGMRSPRWVLLALGLALVLIAVTLAALGGLWP
jgi:uncharacterized membrane protein YidH (DUF202 family)